MRSIVGWAAEALLGAFGLRRRRRPAIKDSRDGKEDSSGGDGEGWEVDPVRFLGACTGGFLAWWMLRTYKSSPANHQPAISNGGPLPALVGGTQRIALSEFLALLRGGAVSAVTYLADRPPAGALLVTPAQRSGSGQAAAAPARMEALLLPGSHQGIFEELRAQQGVLFECAEMVSAEDSDFSKLSMLIDAGGLLASVAALVFLLRSSNGGGSLFTGKHLEDTSQQEGDRRPAVTFEDVAGMEGTKEELNEVISFLRCPSSFYALGARPPKGILLAGPSGTGKTLLARAVAGEAQVPFLYASSAAFVEIYVGQGAQRIRQFFEQARECAPCIVFLDELDAVGAARQQSAAGGNQEYAQTLNQLLLELDGIETTGGSAGGEAGAPALPVVVTMAATNRYDCLDEALVRPGRLDRIVLVGLPNREERTATLKIHARKLRTEGLDFEGLAGRTEGCSGADLANLLNEAALLAARKRAEAVGMEHVEQVLSNPRPQQNKGQQSNGWFTPEDHHDAGESPASAEIFHRTLAALAAMMAAGGGQAARHGRAEMDAESLD